MTPLHEQAADLLEVIWRGIPADYKSRYRTSVWQQFEDNIRSAAYTSNLGKFINSLCYKLRAQVGRNAEERAIANQILQEVDGKALLKLFREETISLVLMVCVRNQERGETWKAEHGLLEKGD